MTSICIKIFYYYLELFNLYVSREYFLSVHNFITFSNSNTLWLRLFNFLAKPTSCSFHFVNFRLGFKLRNLTRAKLTSPSSNLLHATTKFAPMIKSKRQRQETERETSKYTNADYVISKCKFHPFFFKTLPTQTLYI